MSLHISARQRRHLFLLDVAKTPIAGDALGYVAGLLRSCCLISEICRKCPKHECQRVPSSTLISGDAHCYDRP